MTQIIQGKWEDLIHKVDLRGHTVRIVVLDTQPSDNPWVKSLRAWSDSHKPLGHTVDDGRESIYCATADDPR